MTKVYKGKARLLTTQEVSYLLNSSDQYVRDLVKAGRLARPVSMKTGRASKWRLADVQSAIRNGATRPVQSHEMF